MAQIKYPNGPTEELSPMRAIVFRYFVEEEDWEAEKLEGDDLVRTAFEGDNGQWGCFVQVNEEEGQCIFYSIAPFEVPEAKRLAMAEFITRANHSLVAGNFDLDFADGEVRFKTSLDVFDDQLSLPLFRNIVINNLAMMDQYLPSLKALIESDATPAQLIAKLEE